MKRTILISLFIILFMLSLKAQNGLNAKTNFENKVNEYAPFAGKYEREGTTIQFAVRDEFLVLIVPGAPLQKMKSTGKKNEFRSETFNEQRFSFVEDNGKVTSVASEDHRGINTWKKVSDSVVILSELMDSVLV